MADNTTQEPTLESVPAAQEPSSAVQGENQQVQADQSTAPVANEQPATAPDNAQPEIEDWNGNDVETLPKPLQARARGMLRYLHQKSQEAAQVQHLAQAYQELTSHPEFQEFMNWKEQRLNTPQPEELVAEPLSEDDFLAAQTDPSKFVEVQEKLLMQKAAPFLKKVEALENKIAQYEQKERHAEAARQLDGFATQHPDFWKINPVVMKACLDEVMVKNHGTIEEAYNQAKTLEKQYLDQAKVTINKKVEEKKKAVTATPSKSLDPGIVYVSSEREANKVAAENALLGKRVDVRVKR